MEEKNQIRPHIAPTVGRVVWYWPGGADEKDTMDYDGEQPMRADICYVNDDGTVNLSVNDCVGVPFTRRDIVLYQGDHLGCSLQRPFATWMPYQKGQAAKTEAADAKAQEGNDLSAERERLHLELLREQVRELRLQNNALEIMNAKPRRF